MYRLNAGVAACKYFGPQSAHGYLMFVFLVQSHTQSPKQTNIGRSAETNVDKKNLML